MKFSLSNKITGNKKKVLVNVAWALLGKSINMLSVLFVGILVARYLGPEQYGLMNYVISYVTLFTILSSFGLDNIEIRELSKHGDRKDCIIGTCLRLRFIFSTIAILILLVTLIFLKKDSSTTIMIIAYSLTMYSGCFNVIRNYFTSIVKNEYIVKTEIIRTIIGVAIKIILLLLEMPLFAFILASIFDTYLVASGYCYSYKKFVGKMSQWHFQKEAVPFIIKESFPLLLSGAAVMIYQRIDQVMIGNMIDYESVGYFATAGRFLEIVLFLPTVLVQTVTPILVRTKESSPLEYREKCKQFVSIVTWFSVFISLIVMIISHPLVAYTFGEKYLPAIPILQVLVWKTVGMALSSAGGQLIIMEGIQKWAFIKNILACFVCIGLNYILIPQYGALGSAYVTIITLLFAGCFANVLIPPYHKILKIELYALFMGWKEIINIKRLLK